MNNQGNEKARRFREYMSEDSSESNEEENCSDEDNLVLEDERTEEETNISNEESISSIYFYPSKDNKLHWHADPLSRASVGRYSSENVMNTAPGPTSYATSRVDNIKSSFELFLPTAMENLIIDMTNIEGNRVFGEGWIPVDHISMQAYIGLLLLAGVYRSHGESLESLWDDKKGRPIFRATMSLQRFGNIARALRFDDRIDRDERRARDKLAPIRDLWDKWVINLRKLYNPHETVTVDEQLVAFRGRCPFKQYIPSKPGKYGIKIWVLCDSQTKYAWNLQVYTGKDRNCKPEQNQGKRVVLDLVEDLKGRNVTCDNFFTSYDLGVELLRRKLTMVGTVRKNKSFLPLQVLKLKNKPIYSSEFFFEYEHNTTLVAYIPKKNRCVILLSTLHHDKRISSDQQKKPNIIEFYNSTKSGVDTLDQLIRTYTCKRKTNRWPMALFSNMLDISAYNAFIIWTDINPGWQSNKRFKRRLFLEELGFSLINEEIMRRKSCPRTSEAKSVMKAAQSSGSREDPPKNLKRSRCYLCPQLPNSTKYSNKCNQCSAFICKKHSNVVIKCVKCINNQ